MHRLVRSALFAAAVAALCTACARAPQPAAQNPSPMVEHARAHARLDTMPPPGETFTIAGILPRPFTVFVPHKEREDTNPLLLIHFHGAPYVAMHAAAAQEVPVVLVAVHLGAGSGVYERPFSSPGVVDSIRQAVIDSLNARHGRNFALHGTILSAFSAGYGAVRAILGNDSQVSDIGGVLLLDGLHVSYVPDRTPIASGGSLDTARLRAFVRYARIAAQGGARMLVTHSEIFPGTFASTTETTDFLLDQLRLARSPVLAWGPGGMQLLSRANRETFEVLGFAGNTAPDHVDHYHGMGHFLTRLLELPAPAPSESPDSRTH